jgi:hypothetical protein
MKLTHYYWSLSGNFEYFFNKLETLLICISINSLDLIICGDFNVNFLENTTHKQLLNSLLASYGLYSTMLFPTRIANSSASTINNIFINTVKFNDFIVHSLINGISDHDAQIIALHDIITQKESNYFYFTKKFNKSLALDFNIKLSYESCDSVSSHNDVNLSFNNFLNTYLRIFYSNFPMKKIHCTSHTKAWLTQGIKISCINKRKPYLNSRNSNDNEIKRHYKKYCRILTDVIKLAKKIHYHNLLLNSSNKTKTTWNIINGNINKRPRSIDISFIGINGTKTYNSQIIANDL